MLARAWCAAGLLCAAWVVPATAQQTIAPPDDSKPIAQWVCLLLFAAFITAIAYKNPKRTHQS